jgi:mannose-6-phosphate isomerase-like protein (cupin superfamily)
MPPTKINVLEAVDRKVKEVFHPFVVGDVNDSQVKVAKFGAEFDWHAHEREDEAFFVLRGRIAIDFRDGVSEWAKVILSSCLMGSNIGRGRFPRSRSF